MNSHLIVNATLHVFTSCIVTCKHNWQHDRNKKRGGGRGKGWWVLLKSVFLSGVSLVVVYVREITGSRFLTVQNKLVYGVFAPKTPLKHIPKRTFGPTRRKSNIGWAREANWVLSGEGGGWW